MIITIMETYELRYFLTAAELENVGKAAQRLAVSAPAVSRAIGRLEEELGIQLFERVGRNVVLSGYGKTFQQEASRIVNDLDSIRAKFRPSEFEHAISVSGTEFGLSAYLAPMIQKLRDARVSFSIEVKAADSSKTVERMVADGESQIGIISGRPSGDFRSARLGHLKSRVYVGEGHPLFREAKKEIPVEKVLKHPFAGFLDPFLFQNTATNGSADGWRDDKFPRKIGLRADSIEAALRACEAGLYLSYLPDMIAAHRKLVPLKVTGCPYKCETEIFVLARTSTDFGWMKALF